MKTILDNVTQVSLIFRTAGLSKDSGHYQAFNTLRKAAVAVLAERGIRFYDDVYLVANLDLPSVMSELELLKGRFNEAADEAALLAADNNQIRAKVLRRGYEFQPIAQGIAIPAFYGEVIAQKVAGVAAAVLEDVAATADDMRLDLSKGIRKVLRGTQRTLRPLDRIRHKLESFAFADESFICLAKHIEMFAEALPKQGSFTGRQFDELTGFMEALACPETIRCMARRLAMYEQAA